MKAFTPSARAQAVTIRTYCRPLDEAGSRFETWENVIQRSQYDHHKTLWLNAMERDRLTSSQEQELLELKELGLDRSATVSGRTLWLGGTPYAYERACCQFNCSAKTVRTVYDVVDVAWLLMNGSGVGFKPQVGTLHGFLKPIETVRVVPSTRAAFEKGPQENVEVVTTENGQTVWTIKIGDSAMAWAKAIGKLLNPPKRVVDVLVLDHSNIRGAGGRIKGYGWICNGWKPLADCLVAICQILNGKGGELLDEIDIGEIVNHIGQILSSRRSAEAWLLDEHNPKAYEFSWLKHKYYERGANHLRQSNNSKIYWREPSLNEILETIYQADECGGDPGFVNGEAAVRKMPWWQLFNPCQPSWAYLRGHQGLITMGDLEAGETIWSETGWVTVTKKWSTGVKPVFRYRTTAGVFYGTATHQVICGGQKVEAWTAEGIDCLSGPENDFCVQEPEHLQWIMDGLVLGDGTVHKTSADKIALHIGINDTDYFESSVASYIHGKHPCHDTAYKVTTTLTPDELPLTYDRKIPDRFMLASADQVCAFLKGLYSANGSVVAKNRVTLKSSSAKLVEQVQVLLSSIGIRSYFTTNHPTMVTFANGTYECRESYDVNIQADAALFAQKIGFIQAYKNNKLEQGLSERNNKLSRSKLTFNVIDVEYIGDFEVFDITVDNEPHTYWTGGCNVSNCFEIGLPPAGFCNLTSVALALFGRNFAKLSRAIYLMARANYRQTCVDLRDEILQPEWHQTNEALRLCGVSPTSIVQADWLTDYQIRQLRNVAISGAYSMADELGLPRPKAVTTGKPEGTRTKIAGQSHLELAEGIHRPLARFIFNWVNFSSHDPMAGLLAEAGYNTMPNPSDSANTLVCFPVEYSGVKFDKVNGKELNLEPAVSQLNRYLRWNNLWADYNMSCTISYSPEEIPAVAEWIKRNWNNGFIAVALLRRADPTKTAKDYGHLYMPQDPVEEVAFRNYQARLREVAWDKVTGIHEIDVETCKGGVCPVK